MYLIYVSARPPSKSQQHAPEQDLQPIMLAINCEKMEYFLRESDSKHVKVAKPKDYEDVERIFVNLRCSNEEDELDSDDDHEPSAEGLEKSIEEGDAHLAIALATIFFNKGKIEPRNEDFVEHVRDRSRIADCLVVAGYTDSNCSMQKSEKIAMERAQAIRKILRDRGLSVPIVVVARPSCAFGTLDRYSRRVEVTALFRSGSGGGGGSDDAPDVPPPDPDGKSKKKSQQKVKAIGHQKKKQKQQQKIKAEQGEYELVCKVPELAGQAQFAMPTLGSWTDKAKAFFALFLLLVICLMPAEAWAVNSGDDFEVVVDDLSDWIQGGLGVTISLAAVIVGALLSIVRSNPLPILSGIAFAMILNFTPTIIEGIITGLI